MTKKIFTTVKNLLFGSYVIHHSHVTSKIIGYAHYFYNQKIRENQSAIPTIAHNLFSFDFLFVLKGIRHCVWQTKQLNIGGSKCKMFVQNANIGSQMKFIDTIKYYHQSLASLAKSVDQIKTSRIRSSCQKFIKKIQLILQTF